MGGSATVRTRIPSQEHVERGHHYLFPKTSAPFRLFPRNRPAGSFFLSLLLALSLSFPSISLKRSFAVVILPCLTGQCDMTTLGRCVFLRYLFPSLNDMCAVSLLCRAKAIFPGLRPSPRDAPSELVGETCFKKQLSPSPLIGIGILKRCVHFFFSLPSFFFFPCT